MKVRRLLAALLFASCALAQSAQAQQGCSQYNQNLGPFFSGHQDINQHINGSHGSAFTATGICSYTGQAGQPCNVTANASSASPSYSESGTLKVVGYHVPSIGTEDGYATNTNGQSATANSIGAVSYQLCLLPECGFNIGFTGNGSGGGWNATFPPGNIWHDQQNYSASCSGRTAPPVGGGGCQGPNCGPSPVIFDTANVGFLQGMSDPRTDCVLFDLNADGVPICVSWPKVGSGLGWLALPDAKTHQVSSAKQLFGTDTPQTHHPNPQPNGFLALAEWDMPENGGNWDLMISKQDKVWSRLRLWLDTHCRLNPNVPCVASPSDLHPLEEFGIVSISLVYSPTPLVDVWGNQFKLVVHLNVKPDKLQEADADSRLAYDVWPQQKH